VLGIASPELALAYILCIAASVLCIVYGIVKWNDTGPLSEELRDLDQWAPEQEGN
jgi:hypothetical protein